MVDVVYFGLKMRFPYCGGCKGKKGNSNTGERIDLLEEFFAVFPQVAVAYLTADREFVGASYIKTNEST